MEKFKKFWVKSVNNYLCDADYNGKELKARNPIPSFRKFHLLLMLRIHTYKIYQCFAILAVIYFPLM